VVNDTYFCFNTQKEVAMTTQPEGSPSYEVIVWDYDAAPDAVDFFSDDYTEEQLEQSILPYFETKRRRFPSLTDAQVYADSMAEKYIGVAVFLAEERVYAAGALIFDYQKVYF